MLRFLVVFMLLIVGWQGKIPDCSKVNTGDSSCKLEGVEGYPKPGTLDNTVHGGALPQVPVATTQKKDNIEIMFVEDGSSVASVGVRVAEGVKADTAVVRIFYYTTVTIGENRSIRLLRSVVDVIPVVPDAWVAANGPLVAKDQVARVDITLEHDVQKTSFSLIPF